MEKKKLLYQLDTPYSAVSWPEISAEDQDAILELLCNFLSPLGSFRRQHAQPSQGKRIKKRKRREAGSADSGPITPRHLQSDNMSILKASAQSHDTEELYSRYSVVFVARSGQPSGINSHLPQMVAASSGLHPLQSPIRLVGFSKSCEQRLAAALGIPRVSCIGVMEDAPNSKALTDFIHKRVPAIDVSWMKEVVSSGYKDTKIKTIETIDRKKLKLSGGRGRG
ncbi:hypothetical protein PG987_003225 [Apiospora arundinis]